MTAGAVTTTAALELQALQEEAIRHAEGSRAATTLRGYRSDWRIFSKWCAAHHLVSMPAAPATVVLFLTESARTLILTESARTLMPGTLRRRLSSIAFAHELAGHVSPTTDPMVKTTWKGIRRTLGAAQVGKDPILAADLRTMLELLPNTLAGTRDRCVLLLGFASALRRSELTGLDVEDLTFVDQGLVIQVRRSKTDQEAHGRQLGVPHGEHRRTCPVEATRAWLRLADLRSGPLFRPVDRHQNIGTGRLSDRGVAVIVKRAAYAAGLDPDRFAGHSLRSGFATAAARAGATELQIMQQTGHRSTEVLRRYLRRTSLFDQNPIAQLGL